MVTSLVFCLPTGNSWHLFAILQFLNHFWFRLFSMFSITTFRLIGDFCLNSLQTYSHYCSCTFYMVSLENDSSGFWILHASSYLSVATTETSPTRTPLVTNVAETLSWFAFDESVLVLMWLLCFAVMIWCRSL